VGLSSHFATSDEPEDSFTAGQMATFEAVLRAALDAGFTFRDIHIANSGGILNFPASHHNMVRPGLALYGYHPTPDRQKSSGLVPVMSLRTVIGNITRMPAGVSISYGRRYFTSADTFIATLPIGYADGLMRILTNKVSVLIGGRRYPVVGTICMDEVMVDLGNDPPVRVGDEAFLIGNSGGLAIDAWELAAQAGTIPYEICTNVSRRVPRKILKSEI
jgi:alanine racemase